MNFGENLRKLRTEAGLSQKELAEKVGTTPRSILNYEKGARLPKNIEIVHSLAEILGVSAESLMSVGEEFVISAGEQYGFRGKKQAEQVLENAAALFAGGELDEEEMLSFMTRIQTIYLDSKKKAQKYGTGKKNTGGVI